MDSIPTQYLVPAAGAVIAALIAGFFSFLNLVISKEQKVSEFRQAWIDKLREDLCKYIASIRYLASANQVWDDEGNSDRMKHFEAMRSTVDTAAQAYHSIVLRINPNDTNKKMKELNDVFLQALNTVKQNVEDEKYEDARTVANTLSIKMQPILKYEWERVKKGELIYRVTRGTAIFIVIAALAAASNLGYREYLRISVQNIAPANPSLQGALREKAAPRP